MDNYIEWLVKRKRNKFEVVIKGVTIGFTAVFFLIGFTNLLFLVAAVAMGIATYFIIMNLDLEYEYLFVNKELSVDKIMSKSKRKTLININVQKIAALAPLGAYEMEHYKRKNLKKLDFSSGNDDAQRYVIIYNDSTDQKYIIIEPNDKILSYLKTYVR